MEAGNAQFDEGSLYLSTSGLTIEPLIEFELQGWRLLLAKDAAPCPKRFISEDGNQENNVQRHSGEQERLMIYVAAEVACKCKRPSGRNLNYPRGDGDF